MNRTIIAFVVAISMALMTFPGQVTAHESTTLDLNDQAYNSVWPLIGPGGVFSQTLDQANDTVQQADISLPRAAEETGGTPSTNSCTHHADGIVDKDEAYNPSDTCTESEANVENLVAYQCTGAPSIDNPLADADITISSPMEFNHSDVDNGIIEATGSFFVNFEFSGNDAKKVDELWFGFLTTFPWPASSSLCERPFPLPGAYYEFYRGDTDGTDGWEIPINTLLVPDAPYGSLVRAIDSDGNTLAVGFSYANVNNYLNDANWQPSTPSVCDQSGETGTALCPYHDTTPPSATVFNSSKPGHEFPRINEDVHDSGSATDEQQCAPSQFEDAIALEYGEKLASRPAADGGTEPAVEITDGSGSPVDWHNYTAPGRDVDSIPGIPTVNDGTGTTDIWGPGICVVDPPNEMTVKAWDQSGNIGQQVIS